MCGVIGEREGRRELIYPSKESKRTPVSNLDDDDRNDDRNDEEDGGNVPLGLSRLRREDLVEVLESLLEEAELPSVDCFLSSLLFDEEVLDEVDGGSEEVDSTLSFLSSLPLEDDKGFEAPAEADAGA